MLGLKGLQTQAGVRRERGDDDVLRHAVLVVFHDLRLLRANDLVLVLQLGASGFALREASDVLLESAAHKMSKSRGNVVNPVRAPASPTTT